MKGKKLHRSLLIVLFCILLFSSCEEDYVKSSYNMQVKEQTSAFYVNDFANVLDSNQEELILGNAIDMDLEYSGVQIVITTVNSLSETIIESKTESRNFSIDEVATSMFNQYGIGKDDMGVLVLLSISDREIRIELGRKMQTYITDSVATKILDDYGIEYLKEDMFAEGLISIQEGVIGCIKENVPSDWDKDAVEKLVNKEEIPKETEVSEEILKEAENKNNKILETILEVIIASFFLIIFVLLVFLYITEKLKVREYKNNIRYLERKLEMYKEELEKSGKDISRLKGYLSNSRSFEHQVRQIHPDIDAEIKQVIEDSYKRKAAIIDLKISEALKVPVHKDNVEIFKMVIDVYDGTDKQVLKYVTADIEKLRRIYNASCNLKEKFQRAEQLRHDKEKAGEVWSLISKVCTIDLNGNRTNYEKLNNVYQRFSELTEAQKSLLPDAELVKKFEDEYNAAKKDYDDYNAAKKAEKMIKSTTSASTGTTSDLSELEEAHGKYNRLTEAQKNYVSSDVVQTLSRLLELARENKRREETRRKKEVRRVNSTGSISTHAHNNGHGGHSNGAGGKRSF